MEHSSVSYGKVQTIPLITHGLKDLRCCDGDAATLECQVEATPPPDIRWEKSGRLVPLGGDFVAAFDGHTARLSINQVYPEDEGEYTCVAYNELGKAFTSACLVVDVPEEKENLLSQNLIRPPGLLSPETTPHTTPRTTPRRSVSPMPRHRDTSAPPAGPLRVRRTKVAPPKFYAIPHNRVAEEGETVRFQCAIAGHPEPWVTWDKDGSMVTPTARITITERDDLRILEIAEVTVEDAGLYRVTLENDVGKIEASARLDVIGHRSISNRGLRALSASPMPRLSPSFGRRLAGTPTRIGSRATFACDIRGSPTPHVKWYKDDIPLERTARITPSWDGKTSTLDIDEVKDSDEGSYTCVATNDLGEACSSGKLTVLQVDDDTDLDIQAPKIIQPLTPILNTLEGLPIQMEIVVQGTPPFDVVWVKDGCVLPDCDDFQQHDFGDGRVALCLTDVFAEDAGEYFCEVFNLFGEDSTKCSLNVKDGCEEHVPLISFSKSPVPVISTLGANASFCARVTTRYSRTPFFTWLIAGQPVTTDNNKYTVEQDNDVSILNIKSVDDCDAGQVTCIACVMTSCDEDTCQQEAGDGCGQSVEEPDLVKIVCTADLTVVETLDNTNFDQPEQLVEDLVRGICDEGDNVNVVISDTDVDSTNEIKMNTATAAVCCAGASAQSDYDCDLNKEVTGEPAMLLRGPQDTTGLVGGRVLLKATYTGRPEPEVQWIKSGHQITSDTRTTITNCEGMSCLLIEDITTDDSGKYVLTVENTHGTDCHFASVSVEGPPDPPAGVPSVTAGIECATIAWSSSPYDGGRIVKGYIVEMSSPAVTPSTDSNAISDWTTIADNCHSLSYTVRDLKPGQTYSFRVRAFNVHGASEPSQESDLLQLDSQDEACPFDHRAVTLEPGPEFKNRFNVLEELGKGRYGIVHKVVDKLNAQKLAAKFIRCRTAKDRDKVQDEIDIMNSLRHLKLLQLAAAFENPRECIMVMEYISGGELFERVVADDFTLTERDCILFLRQICEGVTYMHSQNVVHLDLKPENIMCHTRTSHQIKIIDFGLAQKLKPGTPVRVLFGTPEFIPPEIINYEPIGTQSDMWSIGVICYVLLSGLSPFMGDNDAETFANITRADYDFDDEAFNTVTEDARDFIKALLIKRKENRLTAEQCLKHPWMYQYENLNHVVISTDKLKKFIIRRKWQKTGNAIRAVGRMATLSASRRNSGTTSTSPRPSMSGQAASISRMSSLNEEETPPSSLDIEVNLEQNNNNNEVLSTNNVSSTKTEYNNRTSSNESNDGLVNEVDRTVRMRVCSERSDSGISDCSIVPNQQNTLLGKKILINDDTVNVNTKNIINTVSVICEDTNINQSKIELDKQPNETDDGDENTLNGNKIESSIDITTVATTSLKKSELKSEIVAVTIKKFDELATVTTKSKSFTKETLPAKELIKLNTLRSKLISPQLPRKSRASDFHSPNTTKRTYSSSPQRLLKTIPPSTKNKLLSPNLNTRSISPGKPKLLPPTSPRSSRATLNKDNKEKLTPNTASISPKNIAISVPKTPTLAKKNVIEKHLDTTSTFQKAAAFWNKI